MDLKQCIHEAGSLFYEHALSQNDKRAAMQAFLAMDTDGSGSVSLRELRAAAAATWNNSLQSIFQLLDVDNSGSLDFDECKALFFLAICSKICDGCGAVILDSVYNCTACLAQRNIHFDLCCNCYPAVLGSHAAGLHSAAFRRQNLAVADVLQAVANRRRQNNNVIYNNSTAIYNHQHSYRLPLGGGYGNFGSASFGGTSNVSINPYHRQNSYNPPPTNNNNNNDGRTDVVMRRLTQSLSIAASVGTIASTCSIM